MNLKNISIKKSFFYCLVIVLGIASCSDPSSDSEIELLTDTNLVSASDDLITEQFNSNTIANATIEKQVAYKKAHLKTIAHWVLKNYNTLKPELASKYKSEQVLTFSVEKLLNDIQYKNKTESDKNLFQAVDAFKNIDGESWYPTIRLMDEVSLNSKSENDNPLTIVEDSSPDGESFTAYDIDANGEPYEVDEEPTEENTAGRNLVIIEIDDTDCHGNQKCNGNGDTGNDNDTGNGGNDGNNGGNDPAFMFIDKMTIKDLKEAWPGRPEIHFKGFFLNNFPFETGVCGTKLMGSSACDDHLGERIKRIKRRDRNDEITVGYFVEERVVPELAQYVFFTIFERDTWPAGKKESVFPFPNGTQATFEWRSWNQEYDEVLLASDRFNGFGIPAIFMFEEDNSDIRYNIQYPPN